MPETGTSQNHAVMTMRPVGTFAISHQLRNDGMIIPITGNAFKRNGLSELELASPVCELGPKSSEELYWGKFRDIYFPNYIYYMKQNSHSNYSIFA